MNYYYKTKCKDNKLENNLPSKIKINLDVSSSGLQNIALLTNWFEPAQALGMISLHDTPKVSNFFTFFEALETLKRDKKEDKIIKKNKLEIDNINHHIVHRNVKYQDRVDILPGESGGEDFKNLYTIASVDLSSYVEISFKINDFF